MSATVSVSYLIYKHSQESAACFPNPNTGLNVSPRPFARESGRDEARVRQDDAEEQESVHGLGGGHESVD